MNISWLLRLLVLLLALALSGCGSNMKTDELSRGIETLQSISASGQVLAEQVSEGKTKNTYVRVLARQLGDELQHETEKLNDASGLDKPRHQAIELAGQVNKQLGDLQSRPYDRKQAQEIATQLKKLSNQASRLSEALK